MEMLGGSIMEVRKALNLEAEDRYLPAHPIFIMNEEEKKVQKALGTYNSYYIECPECGSVLTKKEALCSLTRDVDPVFDIYSGKCVDYTVYMSVEKYICNQCNCEFTKG